jgi:hypothetical protein
MIGQRGSHAAEHLDELLAELEQILEPIQIHRNRLKEICRELVAAIEAPEQPAEVLARIGEVAKKLQPPADLSQDQRRHLGHKLEPTKVNQDQLQRIAKALRPFESVLGELRRVENWIDKRRKLSSGA